MGVLVAEFFKSVHLTIEWEYHGTKHWGGNFLHGIQYVSTSQEDVVFKLGINSFNIDHHNFFNLAWWGHSSTIFVAGNFFHHMRRERKTKVLTKGITISSTHWKTSRTWICLHRWCIDGWCCCLASLGLRKKLMRVVADKNVAGNNAQECLPTLGWE